MLLFKIDVFTSTSPNKVDVFAIAVSRADVPEITCLIPLVTSVAIAAVPMIFFILPIDF